MAEREPFGGIEVREESGRQLVRLWGDVDASLRDQASVAMVRLLEHGGPYVVDTADVTFVDSSAIAFILQLHRVAGDEGTEVVLRNPSPVVTDMLDLIGMSEVLPVEGAAPVDHPPSPRRAQDGDAVDLTRSAV